MPVLFEKRGHVGILTLSRPEARNCWGLDFTEGLATYLAQATEDDDIHCVVLTGDEAGGAFSSGANLKDDKTHNTKSAKAFFDRIAQPRKFPSNLLSDFPKPIIGAINGYAIGVGCIVTFCCDLIVASEKSEWRLPQIALGVLPNYGGVIRLARFVGKGAAMRVGLGFPLTGEEAYRIGLAQWLVPHKEILPRAIEIADQIAAHPPLAARMVKESMNRGLDIPNMADASLVDSYRFMVLEMTEDKDEAHVAWREKRKPKFKGK